MAFQGGSVVDRALDVFEGSSHRLAFSIKLIRGHNYTSSKIADTPHS